MASGKPYYADPDAMDAAAFGISAYMLGKAGHAAEAERYASMAAALFADVPYDAKRRKKILGCVSYHPGGYLRIEHPDMKKTLDVPAPPYETDRAGDEARSLAAGRKFLRDRTAYAAESWHMGWPASAQLCAAVAGKPLRPAGKTLAKALEAVARLGKAAMKIGPAAMDGPVALAFEKSVAGCGALKRDAIGSRAMRDEAALISERHWADPDEGEAGERGGWLLWLPPGAAEDAAAEILSYGQDRIAQALKTLPPRSGAWFPVHHVRRMPDVSGAAADIAGKAVRAALAEMPGGEPWRTVSDFVVRDIEENCADALAQAFKAKSLFDAYYVFLEAARRDEDTEKLFKAAGILPKEPVEEPAARADWLGPVAAASLRLWRGRSRWVDRDGGASEEDQIQFVALAERNARTGILEWMRSEEAAGILAPSPGAYKKCPDRKQRKTERTE